MTNVFQLNYEARLKSWYDLRKSLEGSDIKTIYLAVDNWPGPWELLVENNYCQLARGLGMVYTLQLVGITDIDFCIAIDDNNEEYPLVMVNKTHILNYHPGTVLLNNNVDFTLTNTINIHLLKNKI